MTKIMLLDRKRSFWKKHVGLNKKMPAASRKRHKWGLGLPIQMKMWLMLIILDIIQYWNKTPYIRYYIALSIGPSWGLPSMLLTLLMLLLVLQASSAETPAASSTSNLAWWALRWRMASAVGFWDQDVQILRPVSPEWQNMAILESGSNSILG